MPHDEFEFKTGADASRDARRPVVLVLDPIHESGLAALAAWADVVHDPERRQWRQPGGLDDAQRIATGLIVRGPVTADDLARLPNLRCIVRAGAGVDGIPLTVAQARGIEVTNTPGANADGVAEYVFAALLHAARALDRYDLAHAVWRDRDDARERSFQLRGRRLGIVGMGEIGHRVARIGHFGFGMPVQAALATPRPLPAHVQAVDLATLCATSDVLVICCRLTAQTTGMIGARELALLPAGGLLVNVARGAVIDEQALLDFAASPLRQTALVLDVHHHSPLDAAHPLLRAPRTLLTPHFAALTAESERNVGRAAAASLRERLGPDARLPPASPVDTAGSKKNSGDVR